jgi:hypothetical protein
LRERGDDAQQRQQKPCRVQKEPLRDVTAINVADSCYDETQSKAGNLKTSKPQNLKT